MENNTDISICDEIPLEDYNWDNFSFFDSIKHKIHLFLNRIFCSLFESHDWVVLVTPWNFSEITSVEEFRRYRANQLKCTCCKTIEHILEVDLTPAQKFSYDHYTNKYFKNNT